jgi:gluconolactonase
MYMFTPPQRVKTQVHYRLEDKFRKKARTGWSDPNRLGQEVDSFLEGPSFDRAGNLYFVDIPFGRVFRLSPTGVCDLVSQYDGWPNGLKIHRDGRIFICDYKRGLIGLDAKSGKVTPILATRNSESFKGLNDLVFGADGSCWFTDQGQTGMHDPTGRVYRLRPNGGLDLLLSTVPSPNGLVLNMKENRLFLAVTRQNAVWRCPIMADGSLSKVGTFIQMSGGHGGPDGMALDQEDGIYVCHLGTGIWRYDGDGNPTHLIEACVGHHMTNVAFGGPDNKTLFITESDTGSILRCELPFAGKVLYSHAM